MPPRQKIPIASPVTPAPSGVTVDDAKGSVTYSVSYTKNMDQYESMKIGAQITVPVNATPEMLQEIEETLIIARNIVAKRLGDDLTTLKSSIVV